MFNLLDIVKSVTAAIILYNNWDNIIKRIKGRGFLQNMGDTKEMRKSECRLMGILTG